jgi:hypothetical protein
MELVQFSDKPKMKRFSGGRIGTFGTGQGTREVIRECSGVLLQLDDWGPSQFDFRHFEDFDTRRYNLCGIVIIFQF